MIDIRPIPAFTDNYIWAIVNQSNQHCAIVDPGDAQPVLDFLEQQALTLSTILITHHHYDHTGGVSELVKQYQPVVYAPKNEGNACADHLLQENDQVTLSDFNLQFNVLDILGHTAGHIAYYNHDVLFCGDTLFSAGCGRVFEGTFEQMYQSLEKLRNLPGNTQVFCAHEYTLANLRFAQTVEPENSAIQKHITQCKTLRDADNPTLPSTLALEKQINPFLRCHLPEVQQSASHHAGKTISDPVETFAVIRTWKDSF